MMKWYSLIDKIYHKENLTKAFKQVKRNHGAPGIDGESVEDFAKELDKNIEFLHLALLNQTYEPSPVRRVEIIKPDGGIRLLGIPTVKDRVVQQAIVNIIGIIFDEGFHPSSYGYRPKKSQHNAIAKAQFYLKNGLENVVDMDLSKCFDTLDHEIMMNEVSKKISDGKVLQLIKLFLKSGVIADGAYEPSETGSPQGGVISPLLSNIYLNIFDQKMKSKGIRIVRYADDILIFSKTKQDAGNNLSYATRTLENEMKLTVNIKKTKLTTLDKGVSFLGILIYRKYVSIDNERIKRFKERAKSITKRNSGIPIKDVIKRLNKFLRGWINYYKVANIKTKCGTLMSWIRRRLRMIIMKQWKTYKAMHKIMGQKNIKHNGVKMNVTLWKNSRVEIIHKILPNKHFDDLGLINLVNYEFGSLSTYYKG